MSFRKGWRTLPDVPKVCPVCQEGRRDAESVKVHNLRVSQTGERVYLTGRKAQ